MKWTPINQICQHYKEAGIINEDSVTLQLNIKIERKQHGLRIK